MRPVIITKLRVLLAGILLALLIMGQEFLSSGNAGISSERLLHATVDLADVLVQVHSVGELDAADSVILSSSVRGDRGKIIWLVEDGKQVKRGDVLVRLDPSNFEEEVVKLEASLRDQKAVIDAYEQLLEWEKSQAQREIVKAKRDMEVAVLELRRLEYGEGPMQMATLEGDLQKTTEEMEKKQSYIYSLKELEQRGFANTTEIERIKAEIRDAKQAHSIAHMKFTSYRDHLFPVELEKARAAIDAAEVALEQTQKAGGFKIGQAMAELAKAQHARTTIEHNLDIAQADLRGATITAPNDGMAVLAEDIRGTNHRKPRIGDQVWQNQPLVYLPDISKMIVATQIREIDLHKISIGKPAIVRVDAYPQLTLTGKVESIGVLADTKNEGHGPKYFRVIIGLDDSDPRLRPGMTSRISILCATADGVPVVPLFSVFREGEKFFSYVYSASSFEKREVAIGLQNEQVVEIRNGLAFGERIALSRPPLNRVGQVTLLSSH